MTDIIMQMYDIVMQMYDIIMYMTAIIMQMPDIIMHMYDIIMQMLYDLNIYLVYILTQFNLFQPNQTSSHAYTIHPNPTSCIYITN